jgi:hypothetical protein
MHKYPTYQAAITHQPSFTNFLRTSWCQQAMATTRPVQQETKSASDHLSPLSGSNNVPEIENTHVKGIFDVNHTLIGFLIRREVDSGLAFKVVDMNRLTATQIVNLISRQKLRRRKQLFEERIGKVGLAYCS